MQTPPAHRHRSMSPAFVRPSLGRVQLSMDSYVHGGMAINVCACLAARASQGTQCYIRHSTKKSCASWHHVAQMTSLLKDRSEQAG